MNPNIDYSLYLCTDRALMTSPTLEQSLECALRGGVTVVQLREKDCPGGEFYRLGLKARELTLRYGVPLIVNDRLDVALAVKADGVHVGQGDLPCRTVRSLVGEDMLVGVSASSLDQALQAQQDGADYIGVGAMFATATKTDAAAVSLEELREIRRQVTLPIVAIGGVNRRTILSLKATGVDGVAVVSAIVAQPDVEAAARELLGLWRKVVPAKIRNGGKV